MFIRYFHLYKKDILPFIAFLCLFLLVSSVFVKFCLIDTGIINIIDSTQITVPADANLNSNKIIENQTKTTNNNKDLTPMYKTPVGIACIIGMAATTSFIIITLIIRAVSDGAK